jgi:hypothetical protein
MTARGVGSRIAMMAWESSTEGGWLRSIPKGTICLSAMGTFGEVESFYAEGKEGFDGMKLEANRGLIYIGGFNLHQGSRFNPNGSLRRRMIESIRNIQNLREYGGRFAKQKGGSEMGLG